MENKLISYYFRDFTWILAMTFRRNVTFIYVKMRVDEKLKGKSYNEKGKLNYIQPLINFDWRPVLVSLKSHHVISLFRIT